MLYVKASNPTVYSIGGFCDKVLGPGIIPDKSHSIMVQGRLSWVRTLTDKNDNIYAALATFNFETNALTEMQGTFQLLKLYVTNNEGLGSVIGRDPENRIHFRASQSGRYQYRYVVIGIPLNLVSPDIKEVANSQAVNEVLLETFQMNERQYRWSRVVDDKTMKIKPTMSLETVMPIQDLEQRARTRMAPMVWRNIKRHGMQITVTRKHRLTRQPLADCKTNNIPRMDKLDAALAAIEAESESKEKDDRDDIDLNPPHNNAAQPHNQGVGSHHQ